jgi:hypothetical protein
LVALVAAQLLLLSWLVSLVHGWLLWLELKEELELRTLHLHKIKLGTYEILKNKIK